MKKIESVSPLVSVVLPIYNVEKYLSQCIDSLLNQTMKDIQIICIDDASTDHSGKMLDVYATQDERIIVKHLKNNVGPGEARNEGVRIAAGKYIMFCDPDDWYEPYACHEAYTCISENNSDFSYFNVYIYTENTAKAKIDYERLKAFRDNLFEQKIDLLSVKKPFIRTSESWYKIYNKDFLIKNDIFFESLYLCEDIPFFMRLITKAKSISVLDKPLYYHRMRSDSLISNCSNWYDVIKAFKEGYRVICSSEQSEFLLKSFLPYCINSLLFWYKRFSGMDKSIEKKFNREVRSFFREIKAKYNVEDIENINTAEFLDMVYTNWYYKKLKSIGKVLFRVDEGQRHRKLCIMGIKIKFKKQ